MFINSRDFCIRNEKHKKQQNAVSTTMPQQNIFKTKPAGAVTVSDQNVSINNGRTSVLFTGVPAELFSLIRRITNLWTSRRCVIQTYASSPQTPQYVDRENMTIRRVSRINICAFTSCNVLIMPGSNQRRGQCALIPCPVF